MSTKFKPWRQGLTAALIGAAVYVGSGIAATASAADAPDSAAAAAPLEEIVITGSRIPVSSNLTSTSPIQAVSSQEIEQEGHSDISDVLNELPQNINGSATDFGNNSNPLASPIGFTTVDLRGLGPQRTLVLVDGRRLGVGDSNTGNPNPSPDLDQIPAALVERVDVVTGGASAVYGSDAMAGVVNFIMRKNFEGIEVGGKYDFFQHSNSNSTVQALEAGAGITPPTGSVTDGHRRDLDLVMGTNLADGAGNVTAYFTYHNQDPVAGGSRDFADCELNIPTPTTFGCGALQSSNSNRITVVNQYGLGHNSIRYQVVGTSFQPFPAAGASPPAFFNTFSYELLQRQDERYNAGAMAHLDINDSVKPYMEFGFMDDRTTELVAPTAVFNGSNIYNADGNYLINCSNPLLSAQEQGILCSPAQVAADAANPGSTSAEVQLGRRNIEGGARIFFAEHINYRGVVGLTGDLGDAWKYDAYAQYYYTSAYTDDPNQFGVSNVNAALQVTGTAANPVCVSGPPCVPYNIFTTGGVTPAQLNYLYNPGTLFGTNTEEIQHVDVTGELGKYGIVSPWAKDGVATNIGLERRYEAVNFTPDETQLTGQLEGTGALHGINAAYNVKEAFVEARAPLAQNLPLVYDLSIDAGYRYSDYSTSAGTTQAYKFEVQYAPIQDVRLRYSYDRAVRAPNLIDLYNPLTFGQQQIQGTDPCAPTLNGNVVVPATATLAECQRTGVTAAEYGNGGTTNTINQCTAGQCGQVLGGNSNLKPETADTYSLGLTITPTMLPDFTATIDYWHILLENVITSIPANVIFSGCLLGTSPQYCSLIDRTAGGSLSGATVANGGWISQTSQNIASEMISGIDVQANYLHRLPGAWGSLSANLNGSWLQQSTTTPYPGAHTYDCAGLYGASCNNSVSPTWRHNLRVTWETPWKVQLSANWRFIGSAGFDNNSPDPSLHFNELGFFSIIDARLPSVSYFDLTATWKVYKGIELRAGVNNLFDKDPPILPTGNNLSQNLNIYPTYDVLGRELFVGFKAKF